MYIIPYNTTKSLMILDTNRLFLILSFHNENTGLKCYLVPIWLTKFVRIGHITLFLISRCQIDGNHKLGFVLGIPTCWYLKSLVDPTRPSSLPNASWWNIGCNCVGSPGVGACV